MKALYFEPFHVALSRQRGFIMGSSIIAIMMFHQPFVFGDPFTEVFHLYGYWGVELFLFVSGFGLVYSFRKNSLTEYYMHRFTRILPVCVFVGVLKYILSLSGLTIKDNENFIINLFSLNLWFIYAIVIYYAISPLIINGFNKYGLWLFLILCAISMICDITPLKDNPHYLVSRLGWIVQRLPVFAAGMMVSIIPSNKRDRGLFLILSFVSLMVALVVVLFSHLVRYQWDVPFVYILVLFATPAMCWTLCMLGSCLDYFHLSKPIVWVGSLSLELYLWHEYLYKNIVSSTVYSEEYCVVWLTFGLLLSIASAVGTKYFISKILQFLTTNISRVYTN